MYIFIDPNDKIVVVHTGHNVNMQPGSVEGGYNTHILLTSVQLSFPCNFSAVFIQGPQYW